MQIGIHKNCKYQEVELEDGNTKIVSGLLSDNEAKEYYEEFLQAASEILWNVGKQRESRIIKKVIERLSE